ncbi:hypothetical protein C0J52_16972, partial [Blattella germanica]
GKVIYFKACGKTIWSKKRFQIVQHINTAKHEELLAKKRDRSEAFLAADIPLWKMNDPILLSFLDKYTKRHILANEFLCVSVDETTDVERRFIANVEVCTLNQHKPGELYLLNFSQLNRANNLSETQLEIDSMKLSWPSGIKYNNVLLILTDAANEELKGNLSFILPHFSTLPAVIKTLETAGLPISKSLNVFDTAISDLKSIPGAKFETFSKVNLRVILKICPFLWNKYQLLSTRLSSCDVEKSFSRYKSILRDNRRSFSMISIHQTMTHFVITSLFWTWNKKHLFLSNNERLKLFMRLRKNKCGVSEEALS